MLVSDDVIMALRYFLRLPILRESFYSVNRQHLVHRCSYSAHHQTVCFHSNITQNPCLQQSACTHSQSQQDPNETAAEKIQNLPHELKYRLEVMKMQHMRALSEFVNVIEDPTDSDWLYMLEHCHSEGEHVRYLVYLRTLKELKEKKKEAKLQKKESKQLEMKEKTVDDLAYDRIQLPINKKTQLFFQYNNVFHAMMYGPHVVLDMSFCDSQPMRAVKQVYKQLGYMHGANRRSREPFHLHLCGVSDNVSEALHKHLTDLARKPITISKESYLEHYPKDSLVYLSPDAPQQLKTFNAKDVYIIGGLVDLAGGKFTYPKAKQEGIRSAKLPLDAYVE